MPPGAGSVSGLVPIQSMAAAARKIDEGRKNCAKLLYHIVHHCKLHGEDCMVGICVAVVASGGLIALTMGRP